MPYFGVRANSPLSLCDQRLDHGAGVVDAQADADRHDERQVLQARLPGVREELALADHVEVDHRERRREEQRHVDEHHLGPAHVVAHVHGREHEQREQHHQQVVEVGGEVEERLGLDQQRQVGLQDARQDLAAGLDRALRPAVLLRLEGVHLDRHFRRRDEVLHEHELPAAQLGAVATGRGPRSACRAASRRRRRWPSRRQMPAVPLKLKKQPARLRLPCSSTKWPSSRIAWTRVSSE